ncbi:unnamed protein product [Vitrella brassicaformis CCMP3155]|uniref:Fe2OG dioxygenase domain-containing protein n=1 Tax=Vitrella brassicaformis (strain CCMP3155) TaxID=1169540 RepID=A0A0G4FMD2_VITBC|nr:unnamed protein product [Vitrella brassicaformis CCMP3155]|eukprot:CEM15005.1 unnamed protein product [Vitrella brassicaformis CCMP3155]
MAAEDAIPTIDISPFVDGSSQDDAHQRVVTEIDNACREVGFFYIKGHGVDEGLLEEVHAGAKAFFQLPLHDKMRIEMADNKYMGRGYQAVGENVTKGRRDLHEALDVWREINDVAALRIPTQHLRTDVVQKMDAFVRGKNQWPDASFEALYTQYIAQMLKLGDVLVRIMALALGLAEDALSSLTDKSFFCLRVIGYPPPEDGASCCVREGGDSMQNGVGCGEHTDYGFVTLLNQDDTQSALQAQTLHGEWVDVTPRKGTLVVNLGDMLSVWTGGKWRATPHRVVNRGGQYRTSVVVFYEPNFDAYITSADGAAGGKSEKGVVYGEHVCQKIATNFSFIS